LNSEKPDSLGKNFQAQGIQPMKFLIRRRRQAPAVIIISLIDVLIVMLIFMMVTTTFRQQPALRLALPESRQPKQGIAEARLIVTIAKEEPFFYLGPLPVTLDRLQKELMNASSKDPQISLTLSADESAPFGKIVNVMDAAKAAGIRSVNAFSRGVPGAAK
jgi:biopolymer transport protein ExbD